MEIQLPASELKSALPGLARILNKSSALPALRHLRLTRSKSGAVQLQATDLETFGTYAFAPQPGEPVEVLIPFEPLHKTVKGCSATDPITLVTHDDGLTLRSPLAGRHMDQPLESLDPNQWPAVPTIAVPAESLDENFKEALGHALQCCCSEDSNRAGLQGAWLDVTEPKAHYLIGTDGRHLYAANSFHLALKQSLLIPHQRFLEWSGFKEDGPWQLSVQPARKKDDPAWLQIQSDHWSFIAKKTDHPVPRWRGVVPESKRITVKFSPQASAFLVEVLPKLPGKDDVSQPIRLDFAGGELTVTGKERRGDHSMSFPVEAVEVAGPDISMSVNRDFIAKALKFGLTVMDMSDELSPLLFSAPGKKLVAMPLRTDSTPGPQNQPTATPAAAESQGQPENPGRPEEPKKTNQPQPQPKEQPMPRVAAVSLPPPTPGTTTEPQPVNRLVPFNGESKSPVKAVIEQIEALKDALKTVQRQFGDVVDALRQVDKQYKATDKEIEQIRQSLRAIQKVSI